jgi:hypothetical protein
MTAASVALIAWHLTFATMATAQQASSTVSQSMPPTATAGFNPGNVSSSDACTSSRFLEFSVPLVLRLTYGQRIVSGTRLRPRLRAPEAWPDLYIVIYM